jgi:hypothetical protein
MQPLKFAFLVAWLPGVPACSSGKPVDLGENRPQETGEFLSDYAATWDGYAEAYTFPSGSDRVRMNLDAQGHGTLVLGDATPPPPATDGNAEYPPGVNELLVDDPAYEMYEGVPFTVQQAEVQDQRIQFGMDPLELYKSWCALQTPVLDTTSSPDAPYYSCVPHGTLTYYQGVCTVENPDGTSAPLNCAKMDLCGAKNVCECTAAGCTAGVTDSLDAAPGRFDAALENGGARLVGTLTFPQRITVRLTRK